MAEELLVAKGDTESLGLNWPSYFIKRHPDLKSMFTTPQDKNRYFSDIISHFFELYSETVAKYKIQPEDIYNMDEKGAMMGVIG
jgi:hypothetical protein